MNPLYHFSVLHERTSLITSERVTDLQNILHRRFQRHSRRKIGRAIFPPPVHDIHDGFDQGLMKLLQPTHKTGVRQYWVRRKNLHARVASRPRRRSVKLLKHSIPVLVLVFGGYHRHWLLSVADGGPADLLISGGMVDAAHVSDFGVQLVRTGNNE